MDRHRSVNNLDCWLPAARAGLIGMTPLMNEQFSSAIRQPLLNQRDRRIIINVSGRKFETWEKTLQKYPQTLLGSLELDSFYDKEKKEYFFDRDPIFFRHVLNFYRRGKLHFSLDECGRSYKEELKFFRISQDRMELCCFEEMDEACRSGAPKDPEKNGGTAKCHCKPVKRSTKERIWDLFENPHGTSLGKIINLTVGIAIVVSIITTVVETVPCGRNLTCGQTYKRTFFSIDATCVFIFTIEYFVRLCVAPEKMRFIKDFQNIIDVASVLPFYLNLALKSSGGKSEQLVVLRVLRVFRVVKMARHSKRLRTLGGSIKNSSSELGFILFSFTLGVIIFATVIYYCEKDEPKTTFLSIPDSMWYAIVTMTTLG